ncbi:hypothetical protein [Flavobacterium hydatis]|uniref:Fibronectin type-III domain-containing protein n=1 Tax=Flavobacterium hydatis TaxID=991 RepID=A0A085ZZV9_FLAHY|nr:hypothetical protein [Flavobacterium hydatis]KFF09973.1 hypothetical protein IW20_22025 [Flavobacterium hydatis]OXA95310.1 hypothetical protein B0A62_08350 [Flavobacterium hydatis]
MKKKITLLFVSFFILASCSSDEDSSVIPVAPVAPTAIHAVLNEGSVDITWTGVEGAGITYNVYRNAVKINTVSLKEAKFTDVLKSTGSFVYTVTANLGGAESTKGEVSEKVILELPKTKTMQSIDIYYDTKYEYAYTYDASNITKLVSQTSKETNIDLTTKKVTVTNTVLKFTYAGNLITKIGYYSVDDIPRSFVEYVYNAQKKMIGRIVKRSNGSISYTVTYEYNEDGTITETNDSPDSGPGIYTFGNGNLVKYSITTPVSKVDKYVVVTNYVYDSKNEPTLNVLGFNFFVNNSKNNEISSSTVFNYNGEIDSTESSKSDNMYNENGYVLTTMKTLKVSSGETLQTQQTVITYY